MREVYKPPAVGSSSALGGANKARIKSDADGVGDSPVVLALKQFVAQVGLKPLKGAVVGFKPECGVCRFCIVTR